MLESLSGRLLAHNYHHMFKKIGVLDAEYGLRKVGDKFFIGNSDVTVDRYSDFHIRNKHFKGTRGLWELLGNR